MSSRWLRGSSVVVAVAALLVFGPLVRTPWLWDDKSLILESPVLKDRARWSAALTQDFWSLSANPREAGMYRPVVVTTYFADRLLFGTSPVGPHAVNLLLHLLCAALVGLLATRRFGAPPEVGLLASALFVFHPATVEAVANVSSRGDLLATALLLLAMHAVTRSLMLTGLCLFMAQLAKESAFVALPLLLLVEWAADGFTFRRERWLKVGGVALLLTVMSFAVRTRALHGAVKMTDASNWSPLLSGASTVLRYLSLVLLPSPLVPYQSDTDVSWLGVLVVLALLGVSVATFKRAPWFSFAVAWFLVATAPVAQWLPVTVRFSGLLLYLPLVGVALAVSRVPLKPLVLWLIPVAWLVVSLTVVPTWRDDVSLWSANVEAEPELAAPRLNLANALAAEKKPEALDAYLGAIDAATKRDDAKSRAMAELGVGNLLLQRAPEEAARHFDAARAASGGRLWQAGVNLAVAQYLARKPVDAAMTLEAQWNVTPLRPVAEAGFKLGRELNDEAMTQRWSARLAR
ncbi:MAG: hypothetical protein ACO1OB_06490 [Archangium sp.]